MTGNSNSLLYCTDDETVFLVDIPTSIAEAQHVYHKSSESSARTRLPRLLSCPPLEAPYFPTEPHEKVSEHPTSSQNCEDAEDFEELLQLALEKVKRGHGRQLRWCLPRSYLSLMEPQGGKRSIEATALYVPSSEAKTMEHKESFSRAAKGFTNSTELGTAQIQRTMRLLCQNSEQPVDAFVRFGNHATPQSSLPLEVDDLEAWRPYHSNALAKGQIMTVFHQHENTCSQLSFVLPARSTFCLSDCEDLSIFRAGAQAHLHSSKFDIILLDPPWPNRSAMRKGSYEQANSFSSIHALLLALELDVLIAPGGFVGIWTTNRPAFHRLILEPGGLFDAWNVTLIEKWIWLKTTANGEPVTPIDGIWRKPYEVLLVGQAPQDSKVFASPNIDEVPKRVICGVPDLHSRKPCLKELFERLLIIGRENAQILEVFARYLVAGWTSWGNEACMYNWDGYWEA